MGFLIVCGTLTTHDYTLSRTAAMVLLSLVGMGIMAFITLLCTNLVVDIYEFLATAAKEAASRLFG